MNLPAIYKLILLWNLLEVACSSRFLQRTRQNFGYTYTSYQQGISCKSSFATHFPKSQREIQDIIIFARSNNVTVKPIGNLFSATDMICTEGIPISMKNINYFSYNHNNGQATVGAGVTLHALLKELDDFGRAILGIPLYSGVTVGGALATGTHGSSLIFPSSLSDHIESLTVIDGFGVVRNISGGLLLDAFKTHLGLLGVVYEVTFKTTPQYKVRTVNYPQPDEILDTPDKLIGLARSNAFVQFWWFPTAKEVVISRGNTVSMNNNGDCESNLIPEVPELPAGELRHMIEIIQAEPNDVGMFLLQSYMMNSLLKPVLGKYPIYSMANAKLLPCPDAVGLSYKMLSNKCDECAWAHGESSLIDDVYEVVIPVAELGKAVQTMRSILQEYPAEFVTGILFQFVTKSTGLMSVNKEESVALSWKMEARTDRFGEAKLGLPAVQAIIHALVAKHQGRTHWAKNGLLFTSPEMIDFQHSKDHRTFVAAMTDLDPQGVFLNDFGRRMRFGHHRMTLRNGQKHCALLDNCICQTDYDCGRRELGDYVCSSLQGYNVCMDEPNVFLSGKRFLARHLIGKMQFLHSSVLTLSYKFLSPFLGWGV